jgi:MFS family permease
MSLATVEFSLGLAIGPLLAGFLAGYFFSFPFLVGGGLCLAGAGAIWWFVPQAAERFRR